MKSLPNNWYMYEDVGNRAVTLMMRDLKHLIPTKPLPEVRKQLHEQMEKVAKQHGEVYDTEVREAISRCLTRWACEVHELKANCCISHTYWGLL